MSAKRGGYHKFKTFDFVDGEQVQASESLRILFVVFDFIYKMLKLNAK